MAGLNPITIKDDVMALLLNSAHVATSPGKIPSKEKVANLFAIPYRPGKSQASLVCSLLAHMLVLFPVLKKNMQMECGENINGRLYIHHRQSESQTIDMHGFCVLEPVLLPGKNPDMGYSAKPIHSCFFSPMPTFNTIPISITYVQGHCRRFEAIQILCTEC